MKSIVYIQLLFVSFVLLSCSSKSVSDTDVEKPQLSDSAYLDVIDDNTENYRKYSGLYNKFYVWGTILNSKVQEAILDRTRYYKQLEQRDHQQNIEMVGQQNSNQSRFFLSFFSPEKDYRNLHRENSLWKAYLIHNGTKYPGKINEVKEKGMHVKKLYIHHTRWSKPYEVVFNVPMTSVERENCKFILSSSAGKAVMNFKPVIN